MLDLVGWNWGVTIASVALIVSATLGLINFFGQRKSIERQEESLGIARKVLENQRDVISIEAFLGFIQAVQSISMELPTQQRIDDEDWPEDYFPIRPALGKVELLAPKVYRACNAILIVVQVFHGMLPLSALEQMPGITVEGNPDLLSRQKKGKILCELLDDLVEKSLRIASDAYGRKTL